MVIVRVDDYTQGRLVLLILVLGVRIRNFFNKLFKKTKLVFFSELNSKSLLETSKEDHRFNDEDLFLLFWVKHSLTVGKSVGINALFYNVWLLPSELITDLMHDVV